ncbi:Uma2 family endonuclease [Streptomyces sp. H27-D2]|uniref:Uma2 family endonuclease n=1 Tax=Streptomyces sp. H27-D2 TaxID=3046304 RepID=UPI002DBC18A2|nr:Uma2 family endonuclease [Streptomyces sp. H27-D2]MEC4016418.1 Uma2 family endonuclease [Streptomyces sp. H27-D2]
MTALAHESPETVPGPDLDEVLWQAWKAMELPEGFHAEIIEGFIEVSPTGRHAHGQIANRLRDALVLFLLDSGYAAYQDMNVLHGLKPWIPDLFIAPQDTSEIVVEDGLGVAASGVQLIVEVVSPGHEDKKRDRVRKRRAYARAGVPVYVLVDDYDAHGTVTVLTSPSPGEASYAAETRVPYGTHVTIPEGPAKGFVITEAVTGPLRA